VPGEPPRAAEGGGPLRPAVALAFALIGFATLAIFGLGITSLALNEDVLVIQPGTVLPPVGPIPSGMLDSGLTQLPGVISLTAASAAFAGALWLRIRRPHPSFWGAVTVTVVVFLVYLVVLGITALMVSADVVAAIAVVAHAATSWFGAVIAGAALVASWCGIALVRTRARRPRWPWERDDDDE
jgi:hypothetical protein